MISDPATIVYFYIFYSPVVQFSLHHYSTGVRRQVNGANAIVIQDCGENTCMEFRIPHKHGRKLKEDSMRIVKCNRTRKVFDPFLKYNFVQLNSRGKAPPLSRSQSLSDKLDTQQNILPGCLSK